MASTHTTAKHTFNHHMIAVHIQAGIIADHMIAVHIQAGIIADILSRLLLLWLVLSPVRRSRVLE